MPDRNLVLSIAKVALAAAWADGEITPKEVNSVKEVLMRLPNSGGKSGPQLTAREFAMLEMYARMPVEADERARLLEELQAAKWTPADRQLAIETLTNLIQADGSVTSDEQAVVAEVTAAIDAAASGNTKSLGQAVWPIGQAGLDGLGQRTQSRARSGRVHEEQIVLHDSHSFEG